MNYVCVMPWVVWDWRHEALKRAKIDIDLIDNSINNRGVPRSWNIGIDLMRARDADWLIVMSAAIRFGKEGGQDFIRLLESKPDHRVISALGTFGWHLIAFSRETIETAGRFDENFFPGYLEDIDYGIRMYRVKPDAPWGAYPINVTDAGMAHALRKANIEVDNTHIHTYFEQKWGRQPGGEWHEYHHRPFGDDSNPIGYWPTSPFTGGTWNDDITETT